MESYTREARLEKHSSASYQPGTLEVKYNYEILKNLKKQNAFKLFNLFNLISKKCRPD